MNVGISMWNRVGMFLMGMSYERQSSGFESQDSGFGVEDFGFQALGFWIYGLGFGIEWFETFMANKVRTHNPAAVGKLCIIPQN